MIRNLPAAKTLHLPVALDRPLRQSGSTALQATHPVHADRGAARTGPECFPAYSRCTVEFAAQVLGQASEFPDFGLAGRVARNYATAESDDRTANCRILAVL
jgi:hypothetical protein